MACICINCRNNHCDCSEKYCERCLCEILNNVCGICGLTISDIKPHRCPNVIDLFKEELEPSGSANGSHIVHH